MVWKSATPQLSLVLPGAPASQFHSTTVEIGSRKSRRAGSLIRQALYLDQEDAYAAGEVGFLARALVQATLPHSDPKANEFVRRNGHFTLSILAPEGRRAALRPVSAPCPRLPHDRGGAPQEPGCRARQSLLALLCRPRDPADHGTAWVPAAAPRPAPAPLRLDLSVHLPRREPGETRRRRLPDRREARAVGGTRGRGRAKQRGGLMSFSQTASIERRPKRRSRSTCGSFAPSGLRSRSTSMSG